MSYVLDTIDRLVEVKNTVFYHGTSEENMDSIRKNGIRDDSGRGVDVTTDKLSAGRWGQNKYPDKKIAVVKVDLGKSMHNLKSGYGDTEFRHTGSIPSHAVRGFSKHKSESIFAGFKNGKPHYYDAKLGKMTHEVPSDLKDKD